MKKSNAEEGRYLVFNFESQALEKNANNFCPERKFHIYLPPGYHDHVEKRYPVIYFLHGYGGNINNLVLISEKEIKSHYEFLFRFLLPKVFKNYPTFEKIDENINNGTFPPFILVQPNGSLGLNAKFNLKDKNGNSQLKGSFYANSPSTGKFGDSIFIDLIDYVDNHFRTVPNKANRAIMGASMGGYGTLYAAINHSEKFNSAAALSPVITPYELLNHRMVIPFFTKIYGKKKTGVMGDRELVDLLDTVDVIFSSDARLIPEDMDTTNRKYNFEAKEAIKNWSHSDLVEQLKNNPEGLRELKLFFNSEESDEYNLAPQVRKFHDVLEEMNIPHTYEIYQDEFAAKISPHQIGILSKVMEGLDFCLKSFQT